MICTVICVVHTRSPPLPPVRKAVLFVLISYPKTTDDLVLDVIFEEDILNFSYFNLPQLKKALCFSVFVYVIVCNVCVLS